MSLEYILMLLKFFEQYTVTSVRVSKTSVTFHIKK